MGARFEYEGVVYFKTGPLTASSEAGGQRIIPRHAVLRSLEAPATEVTRSLYTSSLNLPPRKA